VEHFFTPLFEHPAAAHVFLPAWEEKKEEKKEFAAAAPAVAGSVLGAPGNSRSGSAP
jgi:hypothetical protein